MKRTVLLTWSLALVAGLSVAVGAKSPKDEWLPGEKLKECLETAASKDVPVVVLYQFMKASDDTTHDSRVGSFEVLQDFNGMLRVRVFSEAPSPDLDKVSQGTFHFTLPVVFIGDGEGHTIGYISEETQLPEVRKIAKQAAMTMGWKRTSRAALAAVEKQIEAKQLAETPKLIAAYKQVATIAQQDLATTKACRDLVEETNKKARATYEKETKTKATQEAILPITEGAFFTEKTKDLKTKLEAVLADKLKEIEGLITAGDLPKATAALMPLLNAKLGEPADGQIKAVDEKIKAAKKEAGKPKPPASGGLFQ